MKPRLILICLICMAAQCLFAANDLASYKQTYETGLTKIEMDYQEQLSKILAVYGRDLERTKKKVQGAGELAELQAVMAEIGRFKQEKTLPGSPASALSEPSGVASAYGSTYGCSHASNSA